MIDANESRAEYVAAAIDIGTNVFDHTGIQTVARRVVVRPPRQFPGLTDQIAAGAV